jgi:hypothetical protein
MVAALMVIAALLVLRQRLRDIEAIEIWMRSLTDELWARNQDLRRESDFQSGRTITRHDLD